MIIIITVIFTCRKSVIMNNIYYGALMGVAYVGNENADCAMTLFTCPS